MNFLRSKLFLVIVVAIISFAAGITAYTKYSPGGKWRTQAILFENKYNPEIRIEFQMQDVGALGYNRRIVLISPQAESYSIEYIDTGKVDKGEWIFVNKDINELGLKGG